MRRWRSVGIRDSPVEEKVKNQLDKKRKEKKRKKRVKEKRTDEREEGMGNQTAIAERSSANLYQAGASAGREALLRWSRIPTPEPVGFGWCGMITPGTEAISVARDVGGCVKWPATPKDATTVAEVSSWRLRPYKRGWFDVYQLFHLVAKSSASRQFNTGTFVAVTSRLASAQWTTQTPELQLPYYQQSTCPEKPIELLGTNDKGLSLPAGNNWSKTPVGDLGAPRSSESKRKANPGDRELQKPRPPCPDTTSGCCDSEEALGEVAPMHELYTGPVPKAI
ncbi:hypothetical protein M407DRAFT_10566 [Tulasnella calospora MUT 4182]|uniref:Uncharacterized protein n=1 Tax=Tulasnella calospora MUT 4182 TaxID=1051891 RepID=A0A0C3QAD0_9AGAM|nr:hypothetical protein M407DRAFT_10566 [Tulasnella calospora MUT 4182]